AMAQVVASSAAAILTMSVCVAGAASQWPLSLFSRLPLGDAMLQTSSMSSGRCLGMRSMKRHSDAAWHAVPLAKYCPMLVNTQRATLLSGSLASVMVHTPVQASNRGADSMV